MNFLKKTERGFAQLVVLGVMALMAVALPLTTNLVKQNQENRSKAAEGGNIPATGITMNLESPMYLGVGETLVMKYHLIPANSTDAVVWSVTKGSDVATVDANGLVRALKPGEADILGLTSTNRQFAVQDIVVTDKNVGRVNIHYNFTEDGDYRILAPGMDIVSELRINTFGQALSSAEIAYFHTDALEPYLDGVTGREVTKVVSHKKDGNWNSLKVEFDKSKKPNDSVYVLKIKTKIVKNISNGHLEVYKGLSLIGSNGEMKTEILNVDGKRMNIEQTSGTTFVIGGGTTISSGPTVTSVTSKPYLFLRTGKNVYSVGETFTITAGVNSNGNKIGGVDGVLNYKSNVLSLISVKKSPTLVFDHSDDGCSINQNFKDGRVVFTCFVGDSSNDKAVNGNLVDFTFVAKQDGISTFAFECNPGETISDSNVVVNSKDTIDCSKNINLQIKVNGTSSDVGGRLVEGKHVNLNLIKDYKSVISDDKLKLWVSRLDKEYEVLSELTGRVPFDGRKITIKEYKCDENGSDPEKFSCMYWAGAGEVTIWASGGVEPELKKINDTDDWSFGVLHEISHSFDTDGWNFDGELMSNFKMAYFLEKSGGKVWQNNRFYTGKEIKDFYKISGTWGYDDVLKSGNYASDFMAYKLLEIKDKIGGWNTYKQVFKNLSNRPVGSDLERLKAFLNELNSVSGANVKNLFTDKEQEIIKNKFGGGFDVEPTSCVSKEGVNSFSVDTECELGNFRYMTFVCYDGYTKREGGPSSCKSSELWRSYADESCKGHKNNCTSGLVPTPQVISGKPYSYTTASCKSKEGVCATYSKSLSTGAKCKVNGYSAIGKVKTGLCPGNTKTVCCTNVRDSHITPTPIVGQNADLVNGKCGNTRNNCVTGKVDDEALPDTASSYKWKCLGSNGGKNVNCSMSKKVNGKCGTQRNTCIKGTVNDTSLPDTASLYKWKCVGKDGGKTVNCSVRK